MSREASRLSKVPSVFLSRHNFAASQAPTLPAYAIQRGVRAGSKCIHSNGSDDNLLSDMKELSPIIALAFPSAEAMAVCMWARLSAFTSMLKPIEGLSAVPYSLWGKVRNNSVILSAWDRFSHCMTVTRNTLEGVEFMET